ncbi:DUF3108 domain-containing protein [Accumulibacter sp.]|uniref:DUF3108 domain-containing protein n=1 Tax=Accumulibacter sp. TaxID=2053492 RepID=UPI002612FEA0|nr:DUF3108 domain-containing protein [Accumulibacter sp.]
MPIALIIAFAASLGMHALLLFGPDVDLSTASEPPPLQAELLPPAATEPPPVPPPKPAASVARSRTARRKPHPPVAPKPVLSVPDSPAGISQAAPAPDAAAPAAASGLPGESPLPAPAAMALPAPAPLMAARGTIHYRVDRGDQGFAIGRATHDWQIIDGAYRITAVTETSGLVALFKPLRIELESRGQLTPEGLLPERFVTRRKGVETSERADFDWPQRQVRVGNKPPQALRRGAQDLLSFHYQLGLLPEVISGSMLSIATGKKYEQYRIEVLGDEDVETPAGSFRCLHLRVPGVSTTELWLAYDHRRLPVKIQHTDRDGAIYVQTATAIEMSQEP